MHANITNYFHLPYLSVGSYPSLGLFVLSNNLSCETKDKMHMLHYTTRLESAFLISDLKNLSTNLDKDCHVNNILHHVKSSYFQLLQNEKKHSSNSRDSFVFIFNNEGPMPRDVRYAKRNNYQQTDTNHILSFYTLVPFPFSRL